MRIKEFVLLDEVERSEGNLEQEVRGLAYDSRKVTAGQVFFAVPGAKADGHDFIAEAVRRGAAAVVFSHEGHWPKAPASVQVKDVHRTLGLWAAHFYGRPSQHLRLVGVTGTNGKTTLTYLIESVLAAAGLTPGVIGTINYRYPGYETPSHHTTPESLDLEEMLARMVRHGVKAVAMEVSSHALTQQRVRGLEFDVGVFTNLSRDHLDYHRDIDEYFLAKSKLFTDYLKISPKLRKAAVIYGGDPHGRELVEKLRSSDVKIWSYGEERQWDVHPVDIENDVRGLRGTVQAKEQIIRFQSALMGTANLQNILGAIGVARALGIGADALVRGIGQLESVPGRLEKIANDRGLTILVDYAHSPDALEKVLGAVRLLTRGKLITVFGCGGDRDRGKRPLMGEIAARLSDRVVLTSDNPRTEDPAAIVKDVEEGVRKFMLKIVDGAGLSCQVRKSSSDRRYVIELDRRKAIELAIDMAIAGDLILIAGKGHEDYQILGVNKIHFDDREVAREALMREAST
jgi:UDP-N-acetylmuramoyl-L-alanyl-D-glutamate--2,6-diaminopimelate ligase